jgi:ribosomal protein S13
MVVFDVLMAMPKIGRTKATGVLRSKGVSPTKTLGGLTERQRSEVLGMVSYVRPVRRLQP